MTGRRSPPIHLGGPLGLAGLTVLAGAAGLMVIAGNDPSEPDPVEQVSGTTTATTETKRPGETTEVKTEQLEQAVVARPPKEEDVTLPAGTKEPVALPASAEGAEIVYIVRIKGAPEIDTIARNFKRNPDVAQEAYAELCERLPALKEFQLVGASYSGEVKLAYQLAPGVQPTRAVMNDIKDKIMAIEGVAYADPDFVAHPGEDRK